ncbi:unnamed protein product [Plutella xylostella]|uniref:(diamondback moth) hypothetical protein n=1 Tax=Plutella xylostella TaxID=51655 RepID=A0A8S4F4D9_PLUXY|nr:unnamed protein product [Plutella xylostella]
MKELWYYLQHELGAAAAGDAGGERLRDILDEAEERKSHLLQGCYACLVVVSTPENLCPIGYQFYNRCDFLVCR